MWSTSSVTVGFSGGASEVCQVVASAWRMRDSSLRRSSGVRVRSMSATSRSTITRSLASSARRTASVGCAVNTGSTHSRGSSAFSSSSDTPSACSAASTASSPPGCGPSSLRWWSRRRRMRCTRSARLMAPNQAENARTSASAFAGETAASCAASASTDASRSRRAIAARRTASTCSSSAGDTCSASISPTIAPSRRTSSRSSASVSANSSCSRSGASRLSEGMLMLRRLHRRVREERFSATDLRGLRGSGRGGTVGQSLSGTVRPKPVWKSEAGAGRGIGPASARSAQSA